MGGQFGGFSRGGMMNGMRGGPGGMRGGRGGMGSGMMGGMPMGGMPMGAMAGMAPPMGMGQMGGGMPGKINPDSIRAMLFCMKWIASARTWFQKSLIPTQFGLYLQALLRMDFFNPRAYPCPLLL